MLRQIMQSSVFMARFIAPESAAVKAATDAGAAAAGRIGEVIAVQVIPRPHDDLTSVLKNVKKQPAK